jgi:hypothetical protein
MTAVSCYKNVRGYITHYTLHFYVYEKIWDIILIPVYQLLQLRRFFLRLVRLSELFQSAAKFKIVLLAYGVAAESAGMKDNFFQLFSTIELQNSTSHLTKNKRKSTLSIQHAA